MVYLIHQQITNHKNQTKKQITGGTFIMAKELKVGKETEIRKLRLENGVSIAEICKELLMPPGLFSAHECGNRSYKGERLEEFKQDAIDAIYKIVAKRKMEMYSLELNIREDDDEEELIWQCLTTDLYKEALKMIAVGKNLAQISTSLEINERDLAARLKADNITNLKEIDADFYESMFPEEMDIFETASELA